MTESVTRSWQEMAANVRRQQQENPADIPGYILSGHINLHKSPACAAQFVTYVNHAIDNFTMDSSGNIDYKYLKVKRGHRPETVSQWRERRANRSAQGNQQDQESEESDSDSDSEQASPTYNQVMNEFRKNLDKFLKQARNQSQQDPSVPVPDPVHDPVTHELEGRKRPEGFMFALQEPCIAFGKVVNIRGATVIFDMKAKEPRAALVMSSTLNAWACPELSGRDLAVALIKLNNGLTMYVASVYADREHTPITNKVQTLVNKAHRDGVQLLLMGDLNAHSTVLWNSKSRCPRGKKWEEYLANKTLGVRNVGDAFTFNTRRGQTIIDVTLSTPDIVDFIKHWQGADRVPASDHLCFEFVLQLECNICTPQFQWHKRGLARVHTIHGIQTFKVWGSG